MICIVVSSIIVRLIQENSYRKLDGQQIIHRIYHLFFFKIYCHMDHKMYLFAEQIVTTAYFLTAIYTVQITGQVFAKA